MKIKSLLSLLACGVASQFMIGCSSGQYFDFSTPATTYHKAAPAPAQVTPAVADVPAEAAEVTTVVQAEPATAPNTATVPKQQAVPVMEATTAKPVASAEAARTAPLTSAAVSAALASNNNVKELTNELATAKSKKDVKMAAKKLVREAKSVKKANALNQYIKIGLILLVVGALLSVLPGLGVVGGIVAIVGLVFILLGLLEL